LKIRKVTPDYHTHVSALLRQAFPRSNYEVQLIEKLRLHGKSLLEWICIHRNTVVAYIAFSNAFDGAKVCGLHLAPLAVKQSMQHQGIGSELVRFALRQDVIRERTIYVLGDPRFYQKFGFERCLTPVCPYDKNNTHFLSIGNDTSRRFTVGYEPEFKT